jgi:hypothetical protein
MLTLGWSDGNPFIPTAFSLLSSAKESNVFQPAQDGIGKRTTAYKRRMAAVSKATEVIFQLLDSAKGLPAKYVLFDSWYGLPVTIYGIWKKSYDVICMVKDSSKIHDCLNEKWVDIKKLHSIVCETAEKNGKILGSITVSIRESKDNPALLLVLLQHIRLSPRKWQQLSLILFSTVFLAFGSRNYS